MNKKEEMDQLLFIIETVTKSLAKLIEEARFNSEPVKFNWANFCRAQERLKEER